MQRKTSVFGYIFLLAALLLSACAVQPVHTVEFEFGTHPQLGFPEQHVLIGQADLAPDQAIRIKGDAASEPANLAQIAYAAADDLGHDPFELGENPLGPFPKGEALGFTLGEWLAAEGSGTYRVNGAAAEVDIRLNNLVPNGLYTLWCTRITLPPEFLMINKPCGPLDGSENSFTADESGRTHFQISTWALEDTSEETVSVLAIAYHSDGNTYGASPGTFGLNSHVQVFTILPPLADTNAWQTAWLPVAAIAQ